MNPSNTPRAAGLDPELAAQERSNFIAWLTFHAVALWSAGARWLKFKRVCAWHEPKPRRLGGNPFARRTTYGMCGECFARLSAEINAHAQFSTQGSQLISISHGETALRALIIAEDRRSGRPSLLAPPARNCAVPARLQRPSAGDPDTTRPAVLRGKTF